ncbi:hypothetical protein jhhlp_000923 [Lomentospora prolificans]|uniref:RNA polymerase II transcription factor B subunit 3 n=1 Tax=Lomentospora prolificans TaxID=41688 RepID=A0A2N3NJT7_9PEZI|nr:hypothetical protein jhhlp_000923 [Lomentospora prolificans]
MSRKASTSVARAGALPFISGDNPAEDICPVCKTSRYLNRDLEFLINPDCYHPMCTNCVGRIFKDGPNQCPYAGCYKTLRKRGFRAPWFNDLSVERECDIRKRVAAVFNKVEDDFETLEDYNNYLERVEDLTDALVNGSEEKRREGEKELMEWEAAHKAEIEANKKRRGEADELSKQRMQAEEQAAKVRRLEALREAEEERKLGAKLKEEMLNGLARGEAGQAAETMNRIMLKRRGEGKRQQQVSYGDGTNPNLSIRGLKEKKRADDNLPYDPFGGLDLTPSRYKITDYSDYHNDWLDNARTNNEYRVGGYAVEEYLSRVMFEAFSGMGVFVEDEKESAKPAPEIKLEVPTKMEVDDVF